MFEILGFASSTASIDWSLIDTLTPKPWMYEKQDLNYFYSNKDHKCEVHLIILSHSAERVCQKLNWNMTIGKNHRKFTHNIKKH